MKHAFTIYLLFLSLVASAIASEPLVVGTREVPPFAMKSADGSWSGLSIDLWESVAQELDLPYQLVEVSLEELVEGVAEGRLDAGVAALTITAERERRVDFTHPFHTSGLGIVVPEVNRGLNWLAVAGSFFSPAFLSVLLALTLVLLVAGLAIWVFEREKNSAQFGGHPLQGLGSGFWWSAVTMTTVGYGDKAPVTLGGRLVALIWMFTSVIIISGFTASIASSLTVSSLDSPIQNPSDLVRYRVAALEGSTGADYLREEGVRLVSYRSLNDALEAVLSGEVQALVHDRPILQYAVRTRAGLEVLPHSFQRQDYGISLPAGSPLRQAVNVPLLEIISSDEWLFIRNRYLGGD